MSKLLKLLIIQRNGNLSVYSDEEILVNFLDLDSSNKKSLELNVNSLSQFNKDNNPMEVKVKNISEKYLDKEVKLLDGRIMLKSHVDKYFNIISNLYQKNYELFERFYCYCKDDIGIIHNFYEMLENYNIWDDDHDFSLDIKSVMLSAVERGSSKYLLLNHKGIDEDWKS